MSDERVGKDEFEAVRVLAENAPQKFLTDWQPESRANMVLRLLTMLDSLERELEERKNELGEAMDRAATHYGDVIRSLEAQLSAAREVVEAARAFLLGDHWENGTEGAHTGGHGLCIPMCEKELRTALSHYDEVTR